MKTKKEIKLFYQGDGKKFPNDIPKKIRMSILKNLGFFEKLDKIIDESKQLRDSSEDSKKSSKKIKDKKAYPNFESNVFYERQADLNKWIAAAKAIYYYKNNNMPDGFNQVTSGWDDMEKLKFNNWLKFYEGGNHTKYKTAQLSIYDGGFGYILPNPANPPQKEVHVIDELNADGISPREKKDIIEQQRKKIVGRLDSTEKLLRSEKGQIFAGDELETLVEIIHKLKQKIYSINKKTASTTLYDDLIIREANVLVRDGFTTAAAVLYKLAESSEAEAPATESVPTPSAPSAPSSTEASTAPAPTPPSTKDVSVPTPSAPAAPTTVSGVPGTEPMKGQNIATPQLNNNPSPDQMAEGLKGFFDNLHEGLGSKKAGIEVSLHDDMYDYLNDGELIVEAQAAPAVPAAVPVAPSPAPTPEVEIVEPPTNEVIEVAEPSLPAAPKSVQKASDFDAIIDSAFQNVTVNDIINKLEDLTNLFKNREIPRQLAIVDLMLNRVGLSSVFSELSEASGKSIEANNYILSRVENILSKLRGSVTISGIDLKSESPAVGQAAAIKSKIEQDQVKEEKRKQLRKEMEAQEAEAAAAKETAPAVEITEDLVQPAAQPPVPAQQPKV